MIDILQVTTTVSSKEEAERIGHTVVQERLAACAQIQGPVASHYWWQDRIEQAAEWYCHLKTTAERYPALEARLRALHSYAIPEIIAVPISRGGSDYAAWVADMVRSTSP
ncbi:MAG: divalent-cation tolerance protein CutA [Gemmatimonadota bacterium]